MIVYLKGSNMTLSFNTKTLDKRTLHWYNREIILKQILVHKSIELHYIVRHNSQLTITSFYS